MKAEEVNQLLESLHKIWNIEELVSFNEFNIQDRLQNLQYQIILYSEEFIRVKAELNRLIILRDRLSGKKYDQLRFKSDKNLTKYEIEKYYLVNDPDIIKINNTIAKQTIIVEFFETCIKALDKQNWAIKLFLDDRKYLG
jgi:hypothetical protein